VYESDQPSRVDVPYYIPFRPVTAKILKLFTSNDFIVIEFNRNEKEINEVTDLEFDKGWG